MKNLAVIKQNAIQGIDAAQVEILRNTLFKGFSDDEVGFSLAVCNRTGLDPFTRQIHFTKRKNKTTGVETIVITTGIDGFRLTANRSHDYAGSDEPEFELDKNGKPTKATVTVYKMVQGVRCPFTASARWIEFYPGDGNDGFMWRKMPFGQLGKCAEAQALRKAFPAELSNIYAKEEMDQANNDRTAIETKAQAVQRLIDAPKDIPDIEVETVAAEPVKKAEPESIDAGDYIIPIGKKYKGKKLSDVSHQDLGSFVDWVIDNIENKNAQTTEFIEKATAYLEQA